tara:strand:- start:1033 stop:1737 length:705 start_codon:yes stop_codon:yes gene_type:complete
MARQTKDSAHYVNNKEFTAELDKYSRKCRALMEKGKERPVMSRYLGECIIKMANRLSLRPNFVNYSYRDEMVQDAILAAIKYAYRFDGDRFNNGFAFVTQILFSHMVQRIKKEKKKYMLDLKLIQQAEQTMFLHGEFSSQLDDTARAYADQKLGDMEEAKAKTPAEKSRSGFTLRSHTLRVKHEQEAIKAGITEFEVEGKHYKVREAKKEEFFKENPNFKVKKKRKPRTTKKDK